MRFDVILFPAAPQKGSADEVHSGSLADTGWRGFRKFGFATLVLWASLLSPKGVWAVPQGAPFVPSLAGTPESLLLSQVSNLSCYANEDRYRGCVEALDTLSRATRGLGLILTDAKMIAEKIRYRIEITVVEKLGPFSFCKLRYLENDFDDSEKARLNRASYDEWVSDVAAIYSVEKSIRTVNFDEWVRDALKESDDRRGDVISALRSYYAYSRKDPHTRVESTEDFQSYVHARETSPSLSVGWTTVREKIGRRVSKLVPGAAAARAGIHEGDLLLQVDGKEATTSPEVPATLFPVELSRRLPNGSEERRKVWVKGETRSERFVSGKRIGGDSHSDFGGIGFLKIRTFQSREICKLVRQKMIELQSSGVGAWILDLRGNGGGFSIQEACVEGLFLDPHRVTSIAHEFSQGRLTGKIESVEHPLSPTRDEYTGKKVESDFFPVKAPLVILADEATGSAAEYATAALRFHGRALVVGLTTWGKGSEVTSDPEIEVKFQTMLDRTTSVMTLPNGTSFHTRGVPPDFRAVRGFEFPFQAETHARSEASLIPPPISPEAPPVRFPTAHGFLRLNLCVAEFNPRAFYFGHLGDAYLPDLQLEWAKKVAKCWIEVRYPVTGFKP